MSAHGLDAHDGRRSLVPPTLAPLWHWPGRRWVVAAVASLIAALAIGVPTEVIDTSLFTRMTPVRWWDYPVWALSSVLAGLTAATYVRGGASANAAPDQRPRTLGLTLLSLFAVGCPICNKLVVGLIGITGALTYFAPLQPLLGSVSLALLGAGLAVRLRGDRACRTEG